jgi:membrane protein implicated in regulation of membrane protease activity
VRSSEKRELKKKIQRLGLFFLIVFIPLLVVSVLLIYAKVALWLNIIVLVILLFILFFFFTLACNKIDEKKKARMDKKKDPFSD